DDVQGDEMLVEFDDYFLRTLEDNDIDVDAVKAEAQEQMADNAFDGVEGLETVPDAIGELFVVTGDLSAKEHARIQCALQEGVDSAISKTVNAPNESTIDDAKAVFEYVYRNGGKGVTYYRDGTRSKQVLTTRAQNAEFAELGEAEAAELLTDQIEEVFGGIEAFLEHEEVQSAVEAELEELLAAADGTTVTRRERPPALRGTSQRIQTGYGKLYVTINEDPQTGQPFEVFANIGHSGGFTNSFTEALGKVVSAALQAGVDPDEIVDELRGTRSPKVAWDAGEQINSIPDAIGTAMRRYLDDEIERPVPRQVTLDETASEDADAGTPAASDEARTAEPPEPDGGVATAATTADAEAADEAVDAASLGDDDATQSLIDAGESPECPECGSMALHFSEGCKTCESCGWSEC
ncbi:MAG: ribonucleoside-diphosphate reductase, adenosylcobalamin-dependent, partial [Halobacteriaceae archaeon]